MPLYRLRVTKADLYIFEIEAENVRHAIAKLENDEGDLYPIDLYEGILEVSSVEEIKE